VIPGAFILQNPDQQWSLACLFVTNHGVFKAPVRG
jgi:hypothetical protein